VSRTNTMKNVVATAYGGAIAAVSLHSADPGSTGANEIGGGSPAYARKTPPAITAPTTGAITFQVTFDVGSGTTVAGVGFRDSGGNFLDGVAVTAITYSAQGQCVVTVNFQAN
jgi:hypothetical protein